MPSLKYIVIIEAKDSDVSKNTICPKNLFVSWPNAKFRKIGSFVKNVLFTYKTMKV